MKIIRVWPLFLLIGVLTVTNVVLLWGLHRYMEGFHGWTHMLTDSLVTNAEFESKIIAQAMESLAVNDLESVREYHRMLLSQRVTYLQTVVDYENTDEQLRSRAAGILESLEDGSLMEE